MWEEMNKGQSLEDMYMTELGMNYAEGRQENVCASSFQRHLSNAYTYMPILLSKAQVQPPGLQTKAHPGL